MKKIVELYIDFKLQRVKKHYYEDRSLGIRLATVNNLTTLGSI